MTDDRLVRSTHPPRPVAVALLLHGGRERSHMRVSRLNLAALRMELLDRGVRGELADAGVAVYRLRFRIQGWNGDGASAIADAGDAIDEVVRREARDDGTAPPVVVVGHSMGGRTAVHVAGHPAVRSIVGLAPWLPDGEEVDGFDAKRLAVAHGSRDRTTSPSASKRFVERAVAAGADGSWTAVPGEGHALLRYPATWNRFVVDEVIRRTRS